MQDSKLPVSTAANSGLRYRLKPRRSVSHSPMRIAGGLVDGFGAVRGDGFKRGHAGSSMVEAVVRKLISSSSVMS